MKTADIKKGMRVRMRNGWYGTMMDNQRGTTRMVEVEGYYTEIGSVYSHDIVMALPVKGGIWEIIDHTTKELQVQEMDSKFFA
jgi:hypothetical protein